jgi:hypothetical protein
MTERKTRKAGAKPTGAAGLRSAPADDEPARGQADFAGPVSRTTLRARLALLTPSPQPARASQS